MVTNRLPGRLRLREASLLTLASMLIATGLTGAQETNPAAEDPAATAGGTVSQNAAAAADASASDAEAGVLEPEPDGTAEEPPPPTRLETQIEFERLMSEQLYAEAAAIGQRLLELTLAEFGERSQETARAYDTLAGAQRAAQDYEAAELSYLRSVEIYRAIDGPFAAAAIAPTLGLGDSYFDDGQYTNALSAYNEARNIQRRAYGLLDEGQLGIIDRMTRSYQAMDMHVEANEQQLAALNLIERIHPSGSIEMLEGLYRYGRWLRSVGRYLEERAQYERAIRIIRAEHDKDSLLLVTPYREIGNSFREQAFEDPRGAGALNAAREILEMQAEPDALELARVLVDIGDWKTAFSPAGSADSEYLRAWELLGGIEGSDALRAEWFQSTRPVSVLFVRMSTRDLAPDPSDPAAARGKVLVQFDVTPSGRTENVLVVESDPVGFKDEAAVRSISQSRFRPRIADGMLVEARGLGLLFNFSYLTDDDA